MLYISTANIWSMRFWQSQEDWTHVIPMSLIFAGISLNMKEHKQLQDMKMCDFCTYKLFTNSRGLSLLPSHRSWKDGEAAV